jgi:hypothetical protein
MAAGGDSAYAPALCIIFGLAVREANYFSPRSECGICLTAAPNLWDDLWDKVSESFQIIVLIQ